MAHVKRPKPTRFRLPRHRRHAPHLGLFGRARAELVFARHPHLRPALLSACPVTRDRALHALAVDAAPHVPDIGAVLDADERCLTAAERAELV